MMPVRIRCRDYPLDSAQPTEYDKRCRYALRMKCGIVREMMRTAYATTASHFFPSVEMDSQYKAIVSVMMLKEGWDVKSVTTIVGLRAYSAQSNILPEQTLGRGLRKMYPGDVEEYVSVVGTNAFMEFVESIQAEGVVLERKAMGEGTGPKTPLVVEVDKENEKKDIAALDIEIPVLTPVSTGNTKAWAIWTSPRWGMSAWLTASSARRNSGRSFLETSQRAR